MESLVLFPFQMVIAESQLVAKLRLIVRIFIQCVKVRYALNGNLFPYRCLASMALLSLSLTMLQIDWRLEADMRLRNSGAGGNCGGDAGGAAGKERC